MRRNDHLNGGNWRATVKNYRDAYEMLDHAIKLLCQDPPHPRDYYRHDDFTADSVEWLENIGALRKAAGYIADESIALSNLIDERETGGAGRAMELDALRSTARQSLAMATMVESYRNLNARGHRAGGAS